MNHNQESVVANDIPVAIYIAGLLVEEDGGDSPRVVTGAFASPSEARVFVDGFVVGAGVRMKGANIMIVPPELVVAAVEENAHLYAINMVGKPPGSDAFMPLPAVVKLAVGDAPIENVAGVAHMELVKAGVHEIKGAYSCGQIMPAAITAAFPGAKILIMQQKAKSVASMPATEVQH